MKVNKILYSTLMVAATAMSLASCDSYLDKMPDNRAEIDSEEKIVKLLVSAYPQNTSLVFTEIMSDNVDDKGVKNPYSNRFYDQIYHWEDITESDNDDPEMFWEASYNAIAVANQALQSIEEMGGATTTTLRECKAEALLCRAYNHFMLTNVFCQHYNKETSTTDLGIPYATEPETQVRVDYERGTVAEDYAMIEKDLLEALPLMGDTHYTVPKYHFNTKAAYAFASRFFLFYEKWDEAIKYATLCVGSDPSASLRDWSYMATLGTVQDAIENHYIDAGTNANLLLIPTYSYAGVVFGPYSMGKRYVHGAYLAANETLEAANFWGGKDQLYCSSKTYKATNFDLVIQWKYPLSFEYTDAVAGIGYYHTVVVALTTDEALLNRAEAYIMKKQYDEAAADLTLFCRNYAKGNTTVTPQTIVDFYSQIEYCTGLASTFKKHLHPAFDIDAEGSTQESMLQFVLQCKRVNFLLEGHRWFDVKRYGIEPVRRTLDATGEPFEVYDQLAVQDARRAVQIPLKVREAGMEANPR
ncbi:MAG: RagB/SusD family nutrient uptake outer membrane protein [Prevotella sp.]|nr:RagB/SusD family nutrient uptake outer membrane protein [Prevotella sp.]